MGKPRRRTWVWRFERPPAEIWPLIADTARFNEAAALPKHDIEEIPQADGSVVFLASLKRGPFTLHWREKPVNWVYGQWFEHCRAFRNGPFRSLCATFELSPEGAGSRGVYSLTVEPANLLGTAILAGGFFANAGRIFARLAADADRFAAGLRAEPFDHPVPPVRPETARRVDAMVAAIEATPNGHGQTRRLADFIFTAQEVDLWQIRPLKLAREWRLEMRAVVELCLQAVKSGLLELRWDLLCPRCRVAKASAVALDRLCRAVATRRVCCAMSTSAWRHDDSERCSSISLDTPWSKRIFVKSYDCFWLRRVSSARRNSSRSAIKVSHALATSATSASCAALRFSATAKKSSRAALRRLRTRPKKSSSYAGMPTPALYTRVSSSLPVRDSVAGVNWLAALPCASIEGTRSDRWMRY